MRAFNLENFTTYQRDDESGNDYAMARYYASRSGRFLTPDPGHVGANVSDPQSWNAYVYVLNDPINLIDPTGLCPDDGDYETCIINVTTRIQYPGLDDAALREAERADRDAAYNLLVLMMMGGMDEGTVPPEIPMLPNTQPPAAPDSTLGTPATPCPLQAPTGNYTVGLNIIARFQPQMAEAISAAFSRLNAQGIVPMITSGFRNAADQERMRQGAAGRNPAARVSQHQVGLAVDFNSRDGNLEIIRVAMTAQGLTWGGTFSDPDPVHFQLLPAGSRPDPAMVLDCGGN